MKDQEKGAVMNTTTLGILGGLGPMSGVYFCELLTEHTRADCDRQHLDFFLSSRATTPDRTDFILGRSADDPAPVMIEEVKRLIAAGADRIVIPCNTAHYFYEKIAAISTVPIINIIRETVDFCVQNHIRMVGVLATEGTVHSGAYEEECHRAGVKYLTCSPEEQAVISRIIYDQIKKGQAPDLAAFRAVADALRQRGAEAVILGCTELSLLKKSVTDEPNWIDSLEVLACAAIRLCGKEPVGFDERLMKFTPRKEQYYAVE